MLQQLDKKKCSSPPVCSFTTGFPTPCRPKCQTLQEPTGINGSAKRISTFCNQVNLAVRGTKNIIGLIHHDFADYAFLDEYPGTLRWNHWKKKKLKHLSLRLARTVRCRRGKKATLGLGGRRWSSGHVPCEGSAG